MITVSRKSPSRLGDRRRSALASFAATVWPDIACVGLHPSSGLVSSNVTGDTRTPSSLSSKYRCCRVPGMANRLSHRTGGLKCLSTTARKQDVLAGSIRSPSRGQSWPEGGRECQWDSIVGRRDSSGRSHGISSRKLKSAFMSSRTSKTARRCVLSGRCLWKSGVSHVLLHIENFHSAPVHFQSLLQLFDNHFPQR